jgi:branched-chain amino acid transport system ATP-binding protein
VLHGVDLSLAPVQVYALLGPNGAGKSTTLAVASGPDHAVVGELDDVRPDVTGVTPDVLARAGVCLIPEGRGIFPTSR